MTNYTLSAKPRKLFGRKVKALRREGIIPANVFAAHATSTAVQLDHKEFLKVFKDAGESSLINLTIEGEKNARPILVSNYAVNPMTGEVIHVDLHEVNLKEKVTATITLHMVGVSPAVAEGNLVVVLKNEIDVEALPTDLPEHIDIDISGLTAIGDTVHAKDLKIDHDKVKIQTEEEEIIVTIEAQAVVKEPEPVVAEGETTPTEDESAKEGEEVKVEEKKSDKKE